MNKSLRKFISLSCITIGLFFVLVVVLLFSYKNFTINIYNNIVFIFMVIALLVILALIFSTYLVYKVYKNKTSGKFIGRFLKYIIKLLFSYAIFFSAIFKINKDEIRKLFVDINNILVESLNIKFYPSEVIMVVPHCLQNSECTYKITNDINNCVSCGKCPIRDIKKIAVEEGIKVFVVTGGTAARNVVTQKRPKLIFAVACERDLTSGITDISKIPVIGIINDRPNGPCFNTQINADTIKTSLEKYLFKKKDRKDGN